MARLARSQDSAAGHNRGVPSIVDLLIRALYARAEAEDRGDDDAVRRYDAEIEQIRRQLVPDDEPLGEQAPRRSPAN